VKVLDFGLARWLNRARAKSSDRHQAVRMPALPPVDHIGATLAFPRMSDFATPNPSGRREFLATAVGITLGTPIFMSPEQARGESLTPASDMFSFGLLLQVLFTGNDPHPMDLTAREIILRVARGETLPVEGAPGDVAALINRLKQFAPADRPTAIEALERLQFLEDKGPRLARRAIVATAIAIATLGGWRYMVDLKAERAIAVAARAEADQRRGEAEDLIEFMLGDLRKKLEPVGRLDILDDVGKRAITYVDSLHPEQMTADQLARGAKALNQLVEVRIGQGRLDDALHLAQRSLRFTESAVRKAPRDPEMQLAYGTSHFWIGNVQRLQNDLPHALEHLRAYSKVTEELARQYPSSENYQLERAYGHSVVATILERRGEYAAALREFESTRDVKAARVAAKPADLERQADLALTLNKTGFVRLRLGDLRGAREDLARELEIRERLMVADPKNRQWMAKLATSHSYNAVALEFGGDLAGAIQHVLRERALLDSLHTYDAANTAWARGFANSHLHLSLLLLADQRPADALQSASAAQKMIAAPDQAHALALIAAARAQLQLGQVAAARRDATAARAELPAQLPDDSAKRTFAEAGLVLGDIESHSGHPGAAATEWARGATSIGSASMLTDNTPLQALYRRLLLRLGRRAEAAPWIARLDAAGYRQPEFVDDRQRFEKLPTQSASVRLVKEGSARAH
jgi:tetratricopeptide (TPR) repeat protein